MTPLFSLQNERLQKTVARLLLAACWPLVVPAAMADHLVMSAIAESGPPSSAPARTLPPGLVPDPVASVPDSLPPPVRTSVSVAENRTPPPGIVPGIPATEPGENPTDGALAAFKLFPETLVAVPGATDRAENAALGLALKKYKTAGGGDEVASLREFLDTYPSGRWAASLHLNLGLRLFQSSRFSECFSEYRAAWDGARSATSRPMKDIADRAVAELLQLNARIGRADEIESLLTECAGRAFTGYASGKVIAAKEGLWQMKNNPGIAFRCGPGALERIYAYKAGERTAHQSELHAAASTATGFSLKAVRDLAVKVGMPYRMAFRSPGADLVFPSVIHWKVGHYAALLSETRGALRIEDPTSLELGFTATQPVVDAEASGYFLIPEGPLPAGWRAVDDTEGSGVFGKGLPGGIAGAATGRNQPKANPKANDCGMAVYNAHLMVCSLNITDTPFWYRPAYGPSVAFTLTYNQREASQPTTFDYGNVGPKWLNGWISYIDEQRTGSSGARTFTPMLRTQGGGTEPYGGSAPVADDELGVSGAYPFPRQFRTQDLLVKSDAGTYRLQAADGTVSTFGFMTGGSGARRYFLTKTSDVFGNTLTYGYDSQARLKSITDAAGRYTVLDYEHPTNPLLLTKVTEPAPGGRACSIEYNDDGMVKKITDMMGIVSEFTYRPGSDFITKLTTPYGVSTFDAGESGLYRWLAMTDPLGATELVEYRGETYSGDVPKVVPCSEVPAGMASGNDYMHMRNPFRWDMKAYAKTGMDYHGATRNYAMARTYHWLHSVINENSELLESVKMPGETRVWYRYKNQGWILGEGGSSNIESSHRHLNDGTELGTDQVTQYSYNSSGRVTEVIDPMGRTVRTRYRDNLIDVAGTDVKLADGSWETLNSIAYPSPTPVQTTRWGDIGPFTGMILVGSSVGGGTGTAPASPLTTLPPPPSLRPESVTDAGGLTTAFTYNTRGQPLTVTVPDGSVVGFEYGSDGRPSKISGPRSGAFHSYTYDGAGRPRTVTDQEGYAVVYDYDNFDRVTLITYPDGTTQQNDYDRLDLVATKDRSGKITRTFHNALRQVSRVIASDGRMTAYNWCRCGALQDLTDPMGRTTHWDYDTMGRLLIRVLPGGGAYHYAYDDAGRLSTVTDPKGQVTRTTYNKDNTISRVDYENATIATPSVSYAYDAVYGKLTSYSDGTGVTTMTYVAGGLPGAGQITTIDGPLSGDVDKWTLAYDSVGRLASKTLGADNAEVYSYDGEKRIASLVNPLGSFTYGYDGTTTRILSVTASNGQKSLFSRYANGFSREITHLADANNPGSVISDFYHTYDKDGHLTYHDRLQGGDYATDAFRYDDSGRVTRTERLDAEYVSLQRSDYFYDEVDNRTGETVEGRMTGATHDIGNRLTALSGSGFQRISGRTNEPAKVTVNGKTAISNASNRWEVEVPVTAGANTLTISAEDYSPNKNQRVRSWSFQGMGIASRTFTYDANGNLADDGLRTYTWDAANRLATITTKSDFSSNSGVPGGKTYAFAYDCAGRRASESVNGTLARRFIWDGTRLASELDAAGTVAKRFFEQGEQRETSGSGYTSYFYLRDRLGSIRDVTDASHVVIASYDYDTYGRRTSLLTSSFNCDFGFTGHFTHVGSDLVLTQFRAYDPDTGRWLSPDPMQERTGINLYAYVSGSPVNFIDPLGLWSWGGIAKGVLIGLAVTAVIVATGGLAGLAIGAAAGATGIGLTAAGGLGLIGGTVVATGLGGYAAGSGLVDSSLRLSTGRDPDTNMPLSPEQISAAEDEFILSEAGIVATAAGMVRGLRAKPNSNSNCPANESAKPAEPAKLEAEKPGVQPKAAEAGVVGDEVAASDLYAEDLAAMERMESEGGRVWSDSTEPIPPETADISAEVNRIFNERHPNGMSSPKRVLQEKGNIFNELRRNAYPDGVNEVYVKDPVTGKNLGSVDAYRPNLEIIERKNTQLSEIQDATAKSYMRQLNKYENAKIAETPGGRGLPQGDPPVTYIEGQKILEVPPQENPIPQAQLDYANAHGIIIRDTNGKVYNQPAS